MPVGMQVGSEAARAWPKPNARRTSAVMATSTEKRAARDVNWNECKIFPSPFNCRHPRRRRARNRRTGSASTAHKSLLYWGIVNGPNGLSLRAEGPEGKAQSPGVADSSRPPFAAGFEPLRGLEG